MRLINSMELDFFKKAMRENDEKEILHRSWDIFVLVSRKYLRFK